MLRRVTLAASLFSLVLASRCATGPSNPPAAETPREPRPLPTVSTETLSRIEADLVRIPAGTLPADFRTEHAVRTMVMDPPVKISSFWLGKHEVTREEWALVMGDDPDGAPGEPRLPVTNVSWNDAQRFVARLNEARGGSSFRLPTAEEWEFGCRAGRKATSRFRRRKRP